MTSYPHDLIAQYREQLVRHYGEQVAKQSTVSHVSETDRFLILVADPDEDSNGLCPAEHSREEVERMIKVLTNRPVNGIPLSTL